jgi:hypothetical protein
VTTARTATGNGTPRHVANVIATPSEVTYGYMELDSHADTCCVGSNCVAVEYTGKSCNVIGYSRNAPNDGLTNVPIVKASTAYDAPTGETYILVFPQAIYMGDLLDYSLLCPNQLRHNNIIAEDVPCHLAPNPQTATHSITILLQLNGVVSYFVTRSPTSQELEDCAWIMMTSDVEWDPHSDSFMLNERAVKAHNSFTHISDRSLLTVHAHWYAPDVTNMSLAAISQTLTDDTYNESISNAIEIPYNKAIQLASQHTSLWTGMITKEKLAELWGIPLHMAAQTLRVTTQKGIRNAIHPITRRFATKQSRLRYNQLASRHGRFYTDTFFSSTKSTRGNTMAQLYVNDIKYVRIIPMSKKSDVCNTLMTFIQDIGVPASLHSDGAKELQSGKWKDICDEYGIKQTITEPYSPWRNRAKVNIREVKKRIHRLMMRTKTPMVLWDYCATYVAEIMCMTANDLYVLHGRTPHEVVTGITPDITELAEFGWYEPVFYYEDLPFPQPKRSIARWLGIAHRVGQALCYWLLTSTGQVIARTTIQSFTNDEKLSPVIQNELKAFDAECRNRLAAGTSDDNTNYFLQDVYPEGIGTFDVHQDPDEPYENDAIQDEDDEYPDQESYDRYITAQVLLPRGDTFDKGPVMRQKRDAEGNNIGRSHHNPILDTRIYEVAFSDGHVAEYVTNVIAENIYSMIDDEEGMSTFYSRISLTIGVIER